MESLVTGLLYVGLDFFPATPINVVQKPNGDYEYAEIPTLPTSLEKAQDTATKILANLAEIDFKGCRSATELILLEFYRVRVA